MKKTNISQLDEALWCYGYSTMDIAPWCYKWLDAFTGSRVSLNLKNLSLRPGDLTPAVSI